MNREQFISMFFKPNGQMAVPPKHPMSDKWKEAYDDIAPHYYGRIPPNVKENLPNESEELFKYREKTYEAVTKMTVIKAIVARMRVFRHAKSKTVFASKEGEEVINAFRQQNKGVFEYVFQDVYSQRVIDPNGWAVVEPAVYPDEDIQVANMQKSVGAKISLVKSGRIVDFGTYHLVYTVPQNKNKIVYTVVTDEFFGYIRKANDKYEVIVRYQHMLGFLPACVLGGYEMQDDNDTNTEGTMFYQTDLCAAVPFLNYASLLFSQKQAVTVNIMYPTTVVNGETCQDCNGHRYMIDPNCNGGNCPPVACKTCNGEGTVIARSALRGIQVKKPPQGVTEGERLASMAVDPIRFIEPPTGSISVIIAEYKEELAKAEEALSINARKEFAESGEAKRVGMEDSYMQLDRVASYLYPVLLNRILMSIQGLSKPFLRAGGTEWPSITCEAPTSFEIATTAQAMERFTSFMSSSAPLPLREDAFLEYVRLKYSANPEKVKLIEACIAYTPLFLFNEGERLAVIGSGEDTNEVVKANYAWWAASQIDAGIVSEETKEQLIARIAALVQPRLDALQKTDPAQMALEGLFNPQPV